MWPVNDSFRDRSTGDDVDTASATTPPAHDHRRQVRRRDSGRCSHAHPYDATAAHPTATIATCSSGVGVREHDPLRCPGRARGA